MNTLFILLLYHFLQECPSGVVNEETFKEIYSQFFPQGGKYKCGLVKVLSVRIMLAIFFFSSHLALRWPGGVECSKHTAPFLTLHTPSFSVSLGQRELQPHPHAVRFSQWFWLVRNCSSFFLWGGAMLALPDVAIWWGLSLCGLVSCTSTSLNSLCSQSWLCFHLSRHDFASLIIM